MLSLKELIESFSSIDNDITLIQSKLKTNLTQVGVNCEGITSIQELASKILDIRTEKHNKWVSAAKLPGRRSGMFTATIEDMGLVYCICGSNNNTSYSDNLVYNTKTNTWTSEVKAPVSKGGGKQAAYVDTTNEIHMIFNYEHHAYNTKLKTWSKKSDNPFFAGGGLVSQFYYKGIIYVVGGRDYGGNPSNRQIRTYNPSTNTWSLKTTHTTDISYSSKGIWESSIYCFYNNGCFKYDIDLNAWTSIPGLPGKETDQAGVGIDGNIHLIAGRSNTSTDPDRTNKHYCFDILTQTYSQKENYPILVDDFPAVKMQTHIYTFGGFYYYAPATSDGVYCYI